MPPKRKLPDGMIERPDRDGYYADFTVGTKRIRKKLGTDFKAACEILAELKAKAHRKEFGLFDNNEPLAELRKQWINYCKQTKKPRTVECYECWLDAILPKIGAIKVSQITVTKVLNYRQLRLSQGKSPRTINGEVGCLGNMLNWAVEHEIIGSNPVEKIKPLPHDNPKQGRAMSDDEVRRLLEVSPTRWRNIWIAFLVTGLRYSELVDLRFSDIDFENRELTVRKNISKNHTERVIPIENGLFGILTKLDEERESRKPGKGVKPEDTIIIRNNFSTDHVFVTGRNTPIAHQSNIYRAFKRCCQKAGIEMQTYDSKGILLEHLDIHGLRRTFATNLITGGADPKTVQELLGHKTLAMTMKIYTKIRGQNKRQAINVLSYGNGVTAPEHTLPLPEKVIPKTGHQSVTTKENRTQTEAG